MNISTTMTKKQYAGFLNSLRNFHDWKTGYSMQRIQMAATEYANLVSSGLKAISG